MLRATVLMAALLIPTYGRAANVYTTATACMIKGNDMGRRGDAGDAWMWFCMEQNHFIFQACDYSVSAIYKPECWVRRPKLDWPTP